MQILSVYYSFHLVHYVTDTQQTNDAALDMAKHDSAYTVAIWFKLYADVDTDSQVAVIEGDWSFYSVCVGGGGRGEHLVHGTVVECCESRAF